MASDANNTDISQLVLGKMQEIFAYAYHKIVLDESGNACDYEFLGVNSKFEEITGLCSDDIIGKNVTEVLPSIKDGEFNWIEFYGQVALEGTEDVFEQFFEPLGRWYRIHVFSPEEEYFITLFTKISKEIEDLEDKANLLTVLNDIIIEVDTKYTITKVINDDSNLLFLPKEDIISKNLLDLIPTNLAENLRNVFEEVAQSNEKETFECQSIIPDDDRWFKAEIHYIESVSQNKYIISISDITKEKKAELATEDAISRLKLISKNMFDLISLVDFDGNYKFVGPSHSILGYDSSSLIGRNVLNFVHPEDLPGIKAAFIEFVSNRGTKEKKFEWRYRCADGSYLWLESIGKIIFEDDGKPNEIIFNSRDITKRKQAELKLIESEEKYKLLVNNSNSIIYSMTPEGVLIYVSPVLSNILGYEENDIVGRSSYDLIYSEDIDYVSNIVQNISNTGEKNYEFRIICKDGHVKWLRTSEKPVFEAGKLVSIVGVADDITKQKIAEEELIKSEQHLNTLVSNTPAIVYSYTVVDEMPKINYVNENVKHILGFEPDNFVNDIDFLKDCIHPDDHHLVFSTIPEILKKENMSLKEFRIMDKQGNYHWLQDKQKLVLCSDGGVEVVGAAWDITELVTTKNRLKQNEAQFRNLINNVPGAIFRCKADSNWTMFYLSERIKDITGYESSEFIDNKVRSYASIIHPDDRQKVSDTVERSIEEDLPYELAYRIITKDGDIKWVQEHAQCDYTDSIGINHGIITDITDRVIVEQELIDKQNKLSMVQRFSQAGYWENDIRTNSLFWSKECEQLFGLEEGEFEGTFEAFLQRIHPDDRDMVIEANERITEEHQETPLTYQYRIIKKDGEIAWVKEIATVLIDDEGTPISVIGFLMNVDDLKKTQIELAENQEILNKFFSRALAGFFVILNDEPFEWNDNVDKDAVLEKAICTAKLVKVNEAFLNQYRANENDLLGLTPIELYEQDVETLKHIGREIFDKGSYYTETYETRMDGTNLWVEGDYSCLYDEKGRIIGYIGVQSDITERKRINEEILESKRLLETMFESIQDGICIIDPDMTIKKTNKYMEEMYHHNLPLKGKKCYEAFHNKTKPCEPCPTLRTLETNETCNQIVPYTDEKGDTGRRLELYSYPINDNDGNVVNVIEFVRDVTDRMKLEQLERDKVLVQEIHHRVKNNLQVIASLLNMQSRLFVGKDIKAAFKESQARIRSMSLAHEKLYAGNSVASIEASDYISSLVNHITQMNSSVNVPVNLEFDVDDLYLNMDTTIPLGLIINEIVTNSFKHAFSGKDNGHIFISFKESGEGYKLLVKDDGIGLQDDIDINELETLGFKIIHMLVQQLQGTINIDNISGTTYTIRF